MKRQPPGKPESRLHFNDQVFYDPAQAMTLQQQAQQPRKASFKWHKLILSVPDQRDLVIAMPLARAIDTYREGCREMYFARYTAPQPHIEYQFMPRSELRPRPATGRSLTWRQDLMAYVRRICRGAGLEPKLRMVPCTGSWVHAQAFRIACALEDQDINSAAMVADLTHWLYNMLGFTYAQEAENCLKQAHLGLVNSVGYHKEPWFENPFIALRKAQALERAKEGGGDYSKAFGNIRRKVT